MTFQIPSIDISAYVAHGSAQDRAAVARALDEACRTVGFVQIHGHGIGDDVVAGLTGAMDDFFAQDLATKKLLRTPPEVNRGYAPPKTESLSLSLGVESASRMNDFFEAFNVGARRRTTRTPPTSRCPATPTTCGRGSRDSRSGCRRTSTRRRVSPAR